MKQFNWVLLLALMLGAIVISGLIFAFIDILSGQEKSEGGVAGDCSVRPTPAFVEINVSAYCICELCCGRFADGITASGKPAVGLICAAPLEYEFGTKFEVEGVVYVCEDRGGAIQGNKLDILCSSHDEAIKRGRRMIMVKVWRK